MTSGTAALELAMKSLSLKPGDEVIIPTFTIISCAAAVLGAGGVPVLVDADPETWGPSVSSISEKISDRTRAIMPVHIYGHSCDMDPIMEMATENNLAVIEDSAEAHGALYKGNRCGSFGDMSCFSFYANKMITTGEGGMILTNDKSLAARLQSARNLCFQAERRFYHEELGSNYRITNVQAAIGLAQLEAIDSIIRVKREIADAYTARLRDIQGLELPIEQPWARNVYWVYGIVLDEMYGRSAVDLSKAIKEKGIDSRPFFLGMHEQPVFARKGLFKNEEYPVAERLSRQGLYLPSFPAMTEADIDQVVDAVRAFLEGVT